MFVNYRCKQLVFNCLFILVASLPIAAQSIGSSLDLERLGSLPNSSVTSMLTAEQIPTDDVVVPSIYYLGPGDVISYRSTGIDFSEKFAVVSPENMLMLDHFGIVDVTNLTLKALRDTLRQELKNRKATVELFITLRKPRLVFVTLNGNVPFPGTYAVPASMRTSTLISITRQPWLLRKDGASSELFRQSTSMSSYTNQSEGLTRSSGPSLSPYALRNITIRHRKGVSMVDLAMAQLDGKEFANPHVREGDVVTVPHDLEQVPTISVSGAVVTTATLAFKQGDRASVLLAAAGGATTEADLDRVFLVQAGGGGKVKLNVDESLHLLGNDPELEPGSAIVVERKVATGGPAVQGAVEVYGEVNKPGTVIIEPGKTRLLDVIEQCGGTKPGSALSLSYIVRPSHSANSGRDLIDETYRRFMYSDLQLEDTLRFKLDQTFRLPYVSCDLHKALNDSIKSENVVMQSGDIVVIESTPNRIYVYGQVNQPGFVQYVPGKTLEDYVDRAGGFAAGAKEGRSRIIRGKTKVWVEDDDDAIVMPGDEVYVPRAPDIPAAVEIQYYATLAAIVSSVSLLAATVLTILR